MTPVYCLEAGPIRNRTDECDREEERKTTSVWGVTVFHISWLEGLPTNIITYSWSPIWKLPRLQNFLQLLSTNQTPALAGVLNFCRIKFCPRERERFVRRCEQMFCGDKADILPWRCNAVFDWQQWILGLQLYCREGKGANKGLNLRKMTWE